MPPVLLGDNLKNCAFTGRAAAGRRAVEHASLAEYETRARARSVVAARESVERSLGPIAALLSGRSQLEDGTTTILVVAGGCAIEIARPVGNHTCTGIETVAAAGEGVDCGLSPGTVLGGCQLKDRSRIRWAATVFLRAIQHTILSGEQSAGA